MKYRFAFITLLLSLLLLLASPFALAQDEASKRVAPAVATILVRNGAGRFEVVGSGVLVRGDGVLLTANNLVQGAREIQVRLANGETYDHAEVVATDARRNVAVLRIYATSTPFVVVGVTDESTVGVSVRAVHGASGQVAAEAGGVLSSISLADEISGAGTGFRVLKFTQPVTAEAAGGVLVDNYGRALGLIAPLPQAQTQNYAVPLYNVVGLVRSVATANPTATALVLAPGPQPLNRAIPVLQSSTTPLEPMPQVTVPQRPTSPLTPAGPGSVVVRETNPAKLLVSSRTLYIVSYSNVFKSVQLLNELRKKHEFTDWDLSFVDEREVADLILEVEHVALTWEFNFTIKHQRTGIVIATGKIYAWGGGDGAQLMASRVVERLTKLRASVKIENRTENNSTPRR
jgi:S1-C subfamily serine protease